MQPGMWVIASEGRALRIASCGVTPQAQKTGIWSSSTVTGLPYSGSAMSRMPIAAGSPRWTGPPCAIG